MTRNDRTELANALRLQHAMPDMATRMLCTLIRSARTAADKQTYIDAIMANKALLARCSVINGTWITD